MYNCFQNSLADLMNKMNSAKPHFVRCIKPNMGKVAGVVEREYVLAQLRYTGVHETIRIRQQGYAMRVTPDEFISRYTVLMYIGFVNTWTSGGSPFA